MTPPSPHATEWAVLAHAGAALATACWARVATDDAAMTDCGSLVSAEERRRARRYRLDRDGRRFLARRAAVRRMLAARLGRDPASLELRRTALGKPYLADAATAFSASYVDDVVLLVTAPAPAIGCDLAARSAQPLAWPRADDLFSGREVAAMRADPERGSEHFIRPWTLKEACGKAVGCGLLGALDGFDTTGIFDQPGIVGYAGSEWLAWSWECLPGLQAAIVVAGPDFAPIL